MQIGQNKEIETCINCSSNSITTNLNGFKVCSNCGLQQDQVKISRKYNDNSSRNYKILSNINSTRLGTFIERIEKFNRLEKMQRYASKKYEDVIYNYAYTEILGICSILELPENFSKEAFGIFKRVWKKIPKGTKERNYENLVPIVIFRTAKMLEISLDLKELKKEIKCDMKKFKSILISTYIHFPSTSNEGQIRKNIIKICDKLKTPENVKIKALNILKSNKTVLLNTTNDVASCAAISLSVISSGLRKKLPLSLIGNYGKCSSSAISSRMCKVLQSKKIYPNYNIKKLDTILPKIYKKLL